MTEPALTDVQALSFGPPKGSERNQGCPCGSPRKWSACHPAGSDVRFVASPELTSAAGLQGWVAQLVEAELRRCLNDGFTGFLEYSDPVPHQDQDSVSFRLYWTRHPTKPAVPDFDRSTFIDCKQLKAVEGLKASLDKLEHKFAPQEG